MKNSKNVLYSGVVAIAAMCFSVNAHALDMWHSNTVWANQGMCAANFTFDSGMELVGNLKVSIVAVEKGTNKIKGQGVIELEDFGESSADRYAIGYWESELACDDNLYLVVTEAKADIDGVREDLLEKGLLRAREFAPYQIRIER